MADAGERKRHRSLSRLTILLALVLPPSAGFPYRGKQDDVQQQYAPWWEDVAAPGGRVQPRTAAANACTPGCARHGNCNLWTGECECPIDRHGRACEQLVLPACRLGDGSVDVRLWMSSLLASGFAGQPYLGPLSCDCLRQALALRHYLHISPVNHGKWAGAVNVICATRRSGEAVESRLGWRVDEGASIDGIGKGGSRGMLTVEDVLDAPAEVKWIVLPLFLSGSLSPTIVFGGLGSTFFRVGAPRAVSSLLSDRGPPQPTFGGSFHTSSPAAARLAELRASVRDRRINIAFRHLVPRERCPGACGGQGACELSKGTAAGSSGVGRPVCACFPGAERTPLGSCAVVTGERSSGSRLSARQKSEDGLICPRPHGRECAGAGRCDGNGFCHCDPGRWGYDCAHALDARGRPTVRASGRSARIRDIASARPRIFVYTLPPLLSTGPGFYSDMYAAITLRLLESPYREACPEQADYFWLPGPFRVGHAVDKLAYTRARWPYWNGSVSRGDGIARHITYQGWELDPGKIFTGPNMALYPGQRLGSYGAQAEAEINVASPRREWLSLSHNGMVDSAPALPMPAQSAARFGRGGWGAGNGAGGSGGEGGQSAGLVCNVCFQAGKDIVIPFKPGVIDVPRCAQLRERSIWSAGAPRRASEGRETIFFFAGSHPQPKPHAGQGQPGLSVYAAPHVREDIHVLHNRTPGFMVVNSKTGRKVDPVEWMLKSQFCWVPPGQRYGDPRRHILSSAYGCIPVFTLPNARLTFDELLPWSSMAVMVHRKDLPNLPAILRRYSATDRERMRAQLRCAWPRLWWSSIYGACFEEQPQFDAFDALMATLRYRIKGDSSIVKPAYASSNDSCAQFNRPLRRAR